MATAEAIRPTRPRRRFILFAIVLTITCVNLLVSKKHVHY